MKMHYACRVSMLFSVAGLLWAAAFDARAANVALISPAQFQPIKARITDDDPASYTINVKNLSNLGVNEDAPVFAVYISSSAPAECADFTHLSLRYWKPGKYLRTFDLSDNPEVIDAIHTYQCVAVKNIPYNHGRH